LLGVEKQFEPNYVARSYRCVELFGTAAGSGTVNETG
jgi:hypothetical protein